MAATARSAIYAQLRPAELAPIRNAGQWGPKPEMA